MRKLIFLLLTFFVTSCAVTVEPTGESCKRNICTGDRYIYLTKEVTIIEIVGERCRVKRFDGTTYWVSLRTIERDGRPQYVKHPKKEKQNRGRGYGRGRR